MSPFKMHDNDILLSLEHLKSHALQVLADYLLEENNDLIPNIIQ
jgi:hypothetical protein